MSDNENQQITINEYVETHTYVPSSTASKVYGLIKNTVSKINPFDLINDGINKEENHNLNYIPSDSRNGIMKLEEVTELTKDTLNQNDSVAISACVAQDFASSLEITTDHSAAEQAFEEEYYFRTTSEKEVADVILTMREAYSDPEFCERLEHGPTIEDVTNNEHMGLKSSDINNGIVSTQEQSR